jgi:Mrp family chromosome partitioning ATPase
MAQEGRSVAIVDSDLRRPKQHKLFELDNEHGLSDAVLEEHPDLAAYTTQLAPESLIAPFVGDDGDDVLHAAVAGMGDLRVLTSGPIPPNPADLLGSGRMAALLERLAQETDIVLLDCPPVLAVTDAAVLAGRVDGVLLLVNAGSSRRARVQRAAEHLRQVDAPVLGVVVNRVASRHRGYYYYNYYYYSEHEGDRGSKRRRRRRRRVPRFSLPAFLTERSWFGNHNGKKAVDDRLSMPPPAAWLYDRAIDPEVTQPVQAPRGQPVDDPEAEP